VLFLIPLIALVRQVSHATPAIHKLELIIIIYAHTELPQPTTVWLR